MNGNVTIARSLQRAGLDIPMSWPTGYEEETLASFGDLMDNVYFTTGFLPFQSAERSEGMQLYLEQLPERQPDAEIGNQTLIGWINAMLLVEGLDAAGPELSAGEAHRAIRSMDAFDADGIIPAADYTTPPEGARRPGGLHGRGGHRRVRRLRSMFQQPFLCLEGVDTAEELDAVIAEPDHPRLSAVVAVPPRA